MKSDNTLEIIKKDKWTHEIKHRQKMLFKNIIFTQQSKISNEDFMLPWGQKQLVFNKSVTELLYWCFEFLVIF